MKKIRKVLLGLVLVLSTFSIVFQGDVTNAHALDYDQKITIIHTNDVHSYVDVEPYVKGYANKLEAAGEDYTIISAGDAFAGTAFASMSDGLDVARVMNAVGYEMMTLGNHEFAMSTEKLGGIVEDSNFPILGANAEDGLLTAIPEIGNYVIKEYDGVKIAYLGLTTTYNADGFSAKTIAAAEEMKEKASTEGATIFIAVAHLGVKDKNYDVTSYNLADNCPWLTAIIDAHCHTLHENGIVHEGVLIAETGEYGANIGVIEVYLKDKAVVDITSSVIPVSNAADYGITPDAGVQAIIDEVNAKNNAILNEVMFTTPVDLTGARAVIRKQETNLGNIVSDAYLSASQGIAIIGFAPGPTIRQTLPAGDVTYGDLLNTLGSEQRLVAFDMSGEEILKTMETSLSTYPEENNSFQHIAGMKVQFDPSKEAGSRVYKIILDDGRVLNKDETYRVITREDMLLQFLSQDRIDTLDYTVHGSVYPDFIKYAKEHAVNFKAEIAGRLEVVDVNTIIESNVVLNADNFDIPYEELNTLDEVKVLELANVSVSLQPVSRVAQTLEADGIEVSVDADELDTILKTAKDGGKQNLTIFAQYKCESGEIKRASTTVTVSVLKEQLKKPSTPPSTNATKDSGISAGDATSLLLIISLLGMSGAYLFYRSIRYSRIK